MYLTLDEIAKRVKRHMQCNQNEMAGRLDVSQPLVSQALAGEKRHRKTLFRIAEEVGCTIETEPHYFFREPSHKIENENIL